MKIDMAGADSENSENLFLKLTMLSIDFFFVFEMLIPIITELGAFIVVPS